MKNLKVLAVLLAVTCLSFAQNSNYDKNYKHEFSGTTFPKKIGAFLIIGPKLYDEKGMDVGVGYGTMNELELTQYIYPAAGSNKNSLVDEHYKEYKNGSLLKYHPELKIIEETNYTFNGKKGKYGKFKYNGQFHGSERSLISYLYIFEDKGWFIKIRISYPVNKEESSINEIDEYLKNIPWPTLKR
jgi:hypothetical protein